MSIFGETLLREWVSFEKLYSVRDCLLQRNLCIWDQQSFLYLIRVIYYFGQTLSLTLYLTLSTICWTNSLLQADAGENSCLLKERKWEMVLAVVKNGKRGYWFETKCIFVGFSLLKDNLFPLIFQDFWCPKNLLNTLLFRGLKTLSITTSAKV